MVTNNAAAAIETTEARDEHEGWELRELERIVETRTVPEAPASPTFIDALRDARALSGVPLEAGELDRVVHRCAGGCATEVTPRGSYCLSCAHLWRQRARCQELARAYASLDPDEKLAWCRRETSEYQRRVEGALTASRALADETARTRAHEVFARAAWKPTDGNIVLLGESGIGKSTAMIAIGHRILDAASAGRLDATAYKLARGIRYVSGLELGRAVAKHQLGEGDPPLVASAKRASLLLLDEVGYEEQRFDPHAVRDVLDARYRAFAPTITTSGKTLVELNERYGAATMRRLTQSGAVINLHPAADAASTKGSRR